MGARCHLDDCPHGSECVHSRPAIEPLEAAEAQTRQLEASPAKFPGKRRQLGTNWGLCDAAGNWLHIGPNIAAFTTARSARAWLIDPAVQGKDQALAFRCVLADALAH